MLLPIEKIVIHQGRIRTNLRFSYGTVDFLQFAIVEIISGEFIGLGEALGGNPDTFVAAAKAMIGMDALAPNTVLEMALLNEPRPFVEREAFSIGLYDLAGKFLEVPVHTLLGGRKRDRVPLMPCVFPDSPGDAGEKAAKFVEQGYKHLKVKFMGNQEEDLPVLKAIRDKVGDDMYLQADANCGYAPADSFLNTLDNFGKCKLNVIEDPVEGSCRDYAGLVGKTGVKIMVDEKARTVAGLVEVVRSGAADCVNHHPDNTGGLDILLKMSGICESFGMPSAVGGTGYLGIGTAAHQTLASVIGLSFPCGELCGVVDHGFEMALAKELYPVDDGEAIIPDLPGLGVELDRANLERLTDNKVEITKEGCR
jgi:muconate cycloisomerase